MTDTDNKILEDFKKILERKDIDNIKQHYIDGRIDSDTKENDYKKQSVSMLDFLRAVEMHDTIYGVGTLSNKESVVSEQPFGQETEAEEREM